MEQAGPQWRLGKHRGSYAAVIGSGASRRRVKINETDKGAAERIVRDLNTQLARRALPDQITVSAIFKLYIKDREEAGKVNISRMREVEKTINKVWGEFLPDQITPAEVRKFIKSGKTRGLSNATIRSDLAYLTAALSFAVGARLIVTAPKIEKPEAPRPRERWLTRAEADKLIINAEAFHVKLFIALAIATAGRPKHILELTWDRIDFLSRIVNLDNPSVDRTAKGRARVPMNELALVHLQAAKEARDAGSECPYVVNYLDKKVASVRKGIASAAQRAGLADVTPYVLRHTAGVWMAQAGVPLAKIAEYMGHTSIETTRKNYAKFYPDHLKDAAAALEMPVPVSGDTLGSAYQGGGSKGIRRAKETSTRAIENHIESTNPSDL
jgi:integrase